MMLTRLLRTVILLLGRGGGGYREAMCGDLLEELARTGATARIVREVAAAAVRELRRRGLRGVRPTVFAAGWSMLYPVWRTAEQTYLPTGAAAWPETLAWPLASVLHLLAAGLPTLTYVWLGYLLYVGRDLLRGDRTGWFYVLRGVSVVPSVWLAGRALMQLPLGRSGLGVWLPGPAEIAHPDALFRVSAPIALSLLTALLLGTPRRPRLLRGRAG